MASVPVYTYRDAVTSTMDFIGSSTTTEIARRDARRAVQAAYREVASAAHWSYLYQRGRIDTVASYNTGTITYTNSSRALTLASGTWPTWAQLGTVLISNVPYEVASRDSSSQLTLSELSNPGADVAAGTSYTIYQDTYALPADFVSCGPLFETTTSIYPVYVPPSEWLDRGRLIKTPSTPMAYTFTSDPKYFGTMAVRFWPPPSSVWHYDYLYLRRPRQIRIESVSDGSVTVTSGASAVAGTSTAFTSDMVGSIIRVSSSTTNLPESLEWQHAYDQQRTITAYTSSTSVTVDNTWDTTRTGVKYIVSDPIDIEAGGMLNAFLRCAELQVAYSKSMKQLPQVQSAYERALILAREADSRNFSEQVAGRSGSWRVPIKYWPYTAPS